MYKSEKYELVEVDHIRANIDEFCKVVDGWDIGQLSSKLTKNLSCLREPSKKNFIKNILKDFVHQMEDFGMYAASIAIMSPLIEFEIRRRQTETLAMRNLFRTSITYCENIRHIIAKRLLNMTKEEGFVKETKFHDIETILNFSNLKLLKLLFELKDRFTGKKAADICCLVFVERRYSAKCLYYLITKFFSVKPKLKDIVRADFMIGRNSIGPSVETVLERNWNNTVGLKYYLVITIIVKINIRSRSAEPTLALQVLFHTRPIPILILEVLFHLLITPTLAPEVLFYTQIGY